MKIKNFRNKLLLGTLLKTAMGYYKNGCKDEIKISAISIIDNFDVILKNEQIFKVLTNFEQQKFYDEEYYKKMMTKWSKSEDIKVRECIDFKVFYLKNTENSVWYKEAKRIYADGYLILPLSRPIIPNVKRIVDMYNTRYLGNKIVYFPVDDYLKCIEKENECENKDTSKIWGTLAGIILLTGGFFAGKSLISYGIYFTNYTIRFVKESLREVSRAFRYNRDISEAVGRGIETVYATVGMMDTTEEDLNADYLYNSISTDLNEDFEIEDLDLEDEEISEPSDATMINDKDEKTGYVTLIDSLENEIINLPEDNARENLNGRYI